MKSWLALIFMMVTISWLFQSCSSNNNSTPAAPAPVTVYYVPVTDTPTVTNTPGTPTATNSPTVTFTSTITNTPVTIYYVPITNTPTITFTPTQTFTTTSTFSSTLSFTSTKTSTVTNTLTPTLAVPHPYITQWGGLGSGNGQFSGPLGIAVNSAGTTVWVVDVANQRIQYFTGSGTYLGQWGSSGSANGQFSYPAGICADSTGTTIYVCDRNNTRVQYFSNTGTWLGKWGSAGSGPGQFNVSWGPQGVAINSAGTTVYVTDYRNARAEYFDPTGIYLGQFAVSGVGPVSLGSVYPYGIAMVSGGATVVVSDLSVYDVGFYGPTGSYIDTVGGQGSGNLQFFSPGLIGTDPTGNNVYVPDVNNNRVQRLNAYGGYIDQFDGSSSGYPFNTPQGAAVDNAGNVYITDGSNNRIVKFGP